MVGNKSYENTTVWEENRWNETTHKGPHLLLVKMNIVGETELVMINLKNLEDAGPELLNLRISPNTSLKEREQVRVLVINAKN